ncbi:MAG: NAD(P)/FAD-dependent oxidoreductase [Patescibacteria group bacterium]|nr:MAG: NAD(P)/FAD-dependent oxidoreductase [Patescibacteria group bacterium]
MSTRQHYDVIVIGGGASGMMAAGRAASRGRRVLLVEKNKELGKKLSVTGGGRCNIFNAEEDERKLLENYGDAAKFLHSPFSQHGMQDSREFFEKRGLPIVVEARKRAFPASQKATDVVQTMKQYAAGNNVEFKTGTKVLGFKVENGKIVGIETNRGLYTGKAYILATGGSSHQETGSTGEGISWLAGLGHTVHKSNPNVVPLTVEEEWVKASSGRTLSFIKITFGVDRAKSAGRFSRVGKILFTHFGLSGPLILNAAYEVKKLLASGPVRATIDMYPDTEVSALRKRVYDVLDKNKNKVLKNVLKEFAPAGMSEAVAAQLPLELQNKKVHSVVRRERRELADLLKAMPLTITGTMGMDWAVTSDGGVDLKEIDTKTMRSKIYNNLYFTGDVLHINRPSGGYSLQLCWTTGHVAGSHA